MRNLTIKELQGKAIDFFDILDDKIFYCGLACFIRHCFRFTKRLKTWIPLIWNQENWDFEYLYDLIEFKLKEFIQAQEQDYLHEQKGVQRRIRQIKICLAYLDRYRNWPNYYDYPMDDIEHVKTETGYTLKHTNSINEAKRKGVHAYEKFNYDMFWKRFMQWHQGWWT